MKVPTLLITFNRPDYTRQMLEALKAANVEKLYVFKDGPRPDNKDDQTASKEIERLIAGIDWKCEVITMFLNNNLGCGYGPYTAISWAFGQESELIILEDDCVPTKAFFNFCEDMLTKYADNNKVSVISGRNHAEQTDVFKDSDYIFTQYAPTWGWATWKRVWDNFDLEMRDLNSFFASGGFKTEFSTKKECNFFNRRFKCNINDPKLSTHVWDYQFGYHSQKDGALRILPSKNLIKYIGAEGTHVGPFMHQQTKVGVDDHFVAKRHPNTITINEEFDSKFFKKHVNAPLTLVDRVINKAKRIFNNLLEKILIGENRL